MLHADRQSSVKAWVQTVAAAVLILAVVLAIMATAIVGLVSKNVGHPSSQPRSSQRHSSVRQWQYASIARENPDPADIALSNGGNSSTVIGVRSSIREGGFPATQTGRFSNNYSDTGAGDIATEQDISAKGVPSVESNPDVSSVRTLGPTAGVPGNHGRQQHQVSHQLRQKSQQQQRQKQQQQQQRDGLLTAASGSGGRSAQVCVSTLFQEWQQMQCVMQSASMNSCGSSAGSNSDHRQPCH